MLNYSHLKGSSLELLPSPGPQAKKKAQKQNTSDLTSLSEPSKKDAWPKKESGLPTALRFLFVEEERKF